MGQVADIHAQAESVAGEIPVHKEAAKIAGLRLADGLVRAQRKRAAPEHPDLEPSGFFLLRQPGGGQNEEDHQL